jgi:hypothetical protein
VSIRDSFVPFRFIPNSEVDSEEPAMEPLKH